MISNSRRAFTMVELLVVVGMIAVLTGAMTSAVHRARERARIQKATSDVKVISQAILAYETWNEENKLPTMGSRGRAANGVEATAANLGFLIGQGGGQGASGENIPVLLMAQLKSGGTIVDPWGTPYRVTIAKGSANIDLESTMKNLTTRFWLPNLYRNPEN